MAGVSAGAICWFEQGLTDSYAGTLEPMRCLGFLKGSCSPHYSGEIERKPYFERYVREGRMSAGVAIDDGAAVHFVDGTPVHIVSEDGTAGAYWVAQEGDSVATSPLSVSAD